MVRTRTNRGSSVGEGSPGREAGGSGLGDDGVSNSASLRPNKKGRKRQLTEESSSTEGESGGVQDGGGDDGGTTPPLLPPTPALQPEEQHLTFQLQQQPLNHHLSERHNQEPVSQSLSLSIRPVQQQSLPPLPPAASLHPAAEDMQPQGLQWQHEQEHLQHMEQSYHGSGEGSSSLHPLPPSNSPLNFSSSLTSVNNNQYPVGVLGGPPSPAPLPAADLTVILSGRQQQQRLHHPGSSTSSHLEVDTVLPDDLKQNLECPVCARISLPPIMQCRNGHVTCNPCRLKVQSCPMCREIDIDIRNLFAEKAVTFMHIPCEFRNYGCRAVVQYKEKENHERVCKFRPYICPYIECDHKLAANAVVAHVSNAHREECRRSDGPEITASMILIGLYFGGDGAWSPRVITCFGRTFFDVALTRDRWLHHWVWLLGEQEEASNYLYEITAFKGNTKYVYGSEVASLRTSDDEIVSEGKCLSISDAIGRRLRDGDKIRYKLKLMKK